MFKPVDNLSYSLRRDSVVQYREFFIKQTGKLPIFEDDQIKYFDLNAPISRKFESSNILQVQHFYWILDEVTEYAYIPVSKQSISKTEDSNTPFEWKNRIDLSGLVKAGYAEARGKCFKIAVDIYREFEKTNGILTLKNSKKDQPVTRAELIQHLQPQINKKVKETPVFSCSQDVVNEVNSNAKQGNDQSTSDNQTLNIASFPWLVWPLIKSQEEKIEIQRLKILRIIGEVIQEPISKFEHESSKTPMGISEISFERIIDQVYNHEDFDNSGFAVTELKIETEFKPYPAEVMTVMSHMRDVFGIGDRRLFILKLAKNYIKIKTREAPEKRRAELNRLFFEGPRV